MIWGQCLSRYGDRVQEIGRGECLSCPADTGVADRIAKPARPDWTAEPVYLATGAEPRGEV